MPDPTLTAIVLTPQSESALAPCYQLRWEVLRQPWGQASGSERDSLDSESIHKAITMNNRIIATGRLHFHDASTGCIRYMAVHPDYQAMGFGKMLLDSLEAAAVKACRMTIILQARESAIPFYLHNGYRLIRKTHLLYDEIQHFEMSRQLTIS